ncbi:hypothetical protein HPB47_019340 [Ixodes persulcatus]|uniref:Uncharacterized protein n=1 Tax=Ixodes persulcatus TaxID=34615 RepID=A0AC60QIG9_IXOPE|nr:hypothetical protein HPB47_019340 [Ixodes persulcatus]
MPSFEVTVRDFPDLKDRTRILLQCKPPEGASCLRCGDLAGISWQAACGHSFCNDCKDVLTKSHVLTCPVHFSQTPKASLPKQPSGGASSDSGRVVDETLPRDAVALREKYVRLFKPKAYLSDLLTFHYKWVKITLDYLHETFSKGSIGGVDFLDLGCGPTVHCVLSASRCFQCVTLADVSPHCLDVLRKWLRGGDARMQEWRNVLEHVARLEGFE